ncbi:hypothetical protein LTR94_026066, partial [Friedmanniomyces endolithicus]
MSSTKTFSATSLAKLGVERLSALLFELAEGDAALKRSLRLELAYVDGRDVAGEISKRMTAISKSRSFVDRSRATKLEADLVTQHTAIMTYLAPEHPTEAFDLLWRFVELAPSLYERCDDSDGSIGHVIGLA